jgi:hypothetical protein
VSFKVLNKVADISDRFAKGIESVHCVDPSDAPVLQKAPQPINCVDEGPSVTEDADSCARAADRRKAQLRRALRAFRSDCAGDLLP